MVRPSGPDSTTKIQRHQGSGQGRAAEGENHRLRRRRRVALFVPAVEKPHGAKGLLPAEGRGQSAKRQARQSRGCPVTRWQVAVNNQAPKPNDHSTSKARMTKNHGPGTKPRRLHHAVHQGELESIVWNCRARAAARTRRDRISVRSRDQVWLGDQSRRVARSHIPDHVVVDVDVRGRRLAAEPTGVAAVTDGLRLSPAPRSPRPQCHDCLVSRDGPRDRNGTAKDAKSARRRQSISVRVRLCALAVNSCLGFWRRSADLRAG